MSTGNDEIMKGVLRQVNKFDRKGKLSEGTNPQLVAAVIQARQPTGKFSANRALAAFNGITVHDSAPIAQAQPGVMLRRVASIV
jgi:hypothetical protein